MNMKWCNIPPSEYGFIYKVNKERRRRRRENGKEKPSFLLCRLWSVLLCTTSEKRMRAINNDAVVREVSVFTCALEDVHFLMACLNSQCQKVQAWWLKLTLEPFIAQLLLLENIFCSWMLIYLFPVKNFTRGKFELECKIGSKYVKTLIC